MRPTIARGFTLVELMIVVVIVIVLSVVAIGSYRKYNNSARKSEVYALFGEIRTKEEAYRAEFSRYFATGANETTFWPALPNGRPQNWNPPPAAFTQIGINPGRLQVYCGYDVLAGQPNVAPPGPLGVAWWNNQPPRSVWWYAIATCDNDTSNPINALFLTSSDNNTVQESNVNF